VIILPDWNGRVSRAYGARNTGRAAAIVVVDEDSNVALSYQGERPVEAVLGALGSPREEGLRSVLYDSFVFRGEADCCWLPGEEVGDQRGKAPDPRQAAADPDARGPEGQVRGHPGPRSEERDRGFGGRDRPRDPVEAARLFDRLKGVSWRGDYVRSDDGWVAAWVREVN
jgi:hypothetical protein